MSKTASTSSTIKEYQVLKQHCAAQRETENRISQFCHHIRCSCNLIHYLPKTNITKFQVNRTKGGGEEEKASHRTIYRGKIVIEQIIFLFITKSD